MRAARRFTCAVERSVDNARSFIDGDRSTVSSAQWCGGLTLASGAGVRLSVRSGHFLVQRAQCFDRPAPSIARAVQLTGGAGQCLDVSAQPPGGAARSSMCAARSSVRTARSFPSTAQWFVALASCFERGGHSIVREVTQSIAPRGRSSALATSSSRQARGPSALRSRSRAPRSRPLASEPRSCLPRSRP